MLGERLTRMPFATPRSAIYMHRERVNEAAGALKDGNAENEEDAPAIIPTAILELVRSSITLPCAIVDRTDVKTRRDASDFFHV